MWRASDSGDLILLASSRHTHLNAIEVPWMSRKMEAHDLTCDLCGAEMVEQKCKIRCLNCGYTRDCSDP